MAAVMPSMFQITGKKPSLIRVRGHGGAFAAKRSKKCPVMKSCGGTKRIGREEEKIDGGSRKMRRINNSKFENHEPALKNSVSVTNSRVKKEESTLSVSCESSVGVKSSVQVAEIPLSSATRLEKLHTQEDSSSRSPARETHIDPRVEMLKRRFSGIISKAQNALFCSGHSEVKKLKTEVEDPKLKRERERRAARLALEKIERSVEFEDNFSVLSDIASMIGDFPLNGKRILRGLGLYLKEEDYDEYVLADEQRHDTQTLLEDYEEGEIIC